ncbi:MAG: dihydrolipoyl dehydrogenase [Betaproteobacteria bacterium RIFCSPLOWO2_02_FULL_66_14]|nr:MAG: dihydrolipoyl dehydrogenase [Betaproteobacteria bacterium RIFCSPLOWO2_02_FULL_66_14]
MARSFDVVVIGAGPAGYVAAIRAAQLGLNTACIEKWRTPEGEYALGGTCLNVGCIPSKALLESSENYERALHRLGVHGVSVTGVSFDLKAMLARKNQIVRKMTGGIAGLFRKNRIAWLQGHARLASGGTTWKLEVEGEKGSETIEAKHVVIATGSRARHLDGIEVDNRIVCDNEGALDFDSVPRRLGVIGAGVIGLELGSVWRRLGAEVRLLEALPEFLGAADESIAQEAWKVFTRPGALEIELGVKVGAISRDKRGVTVAYQTADGKAAKLACDRLIVSIGRVPNTEGLGAENVGLRIDAKGFIEVDKNCRTSLPRVFAVGDVVRGPMLAHKGEDEGVMVAEIIAGQHGHVNYDAIPWVMYTMPEIAWVGKTEQQLKAEGVAYRSGRFPFAYNGRALGRDESEGFIKMLADAQTDRILGVHAIGSLASELISEAVVAIEFGASSEDIARICHAHPSMSEVMREAALAVDKRSLNG